VTDILKNQVFSAFTWPRKIVVPLMKLEQSQLESLQETFPVALLKVHLIRAKNLPKMDRFGTADPYCIMNLDSQQHRSQTIKNRLDPLWDEDFEFEVFSEEGATLHMTLFDKDFGGSVGIISHDDVIGYVDVPLGSIQNGQEVWLPVSQAKSGEVLLQMTLVPLENGSRKDQSTQVNDSIKNYPNDVDEKMQPTTITNVNPQFPPRSLLQRGASVQNIPNQAYVSVHLLRGENLSSMNMLTSTTLYAKLEVGKSRAQSKSCSIHDHTAEWDEDFKFSSDNLLTENVNVIVFLKHVLGKDEELGRISIPLKSLPYNFSKTAEYPLEISDKIQTKLKKMVKDPQIVIKTRIAPF